MSRLYWKIFGFLLLAQFTAIAIISAGFWLHQHNRTLNSEGVEISPPASTVIQSASATLQHGGRQALTALLSDWQQLRMPQVFAVNVQGKDILNREYSTLSLRKAKQLVELKATRSVQAVTLTNGESYTLFVPDIGKHRLNQSNGKHQLMPASGKKVFPHNPRHKRLPVLPIIAGIFVSLIFAALIAWYFSKPIQLLQSAFAQGAEGNLNSQVGKAMGNRQDAFANLGQHFDMMANRLNKLLTGQKRLLNHVSHELRSPLTRIQIAIGLAKQNPEKVSSSLDRIELESERMNNLIGELLQLSKLESGVSALNKTTINLSHLIQDILDDAKFEATEKGVAVHSLIIPNVQYHGDEELLFRALENVIRNALKYTRVNSSINISMLQQPDAIRIEISDQGDGVDESALEEIFQPFVRTNHAQPKHGYGIGLALAKQIIAAHAGTIKAQNNIDQHGLTVCIQLPTTNDSTTKS